MKRICVWSIFFAFIFFTFSLKQAQAASISLGVFPPIIQIDSTPPADISSPIEIQNNSEDPVQLKIIFKPFKASASENGTPEYLKDGVSFGDDPLFFQKVKILDGEEMVGSIELAPKQVKKLTLNIDIPADQPPSDYYFSVLFISKTQIETDTNNTQAAGGIGTNVLLTIGPKGTTTGVIKEFSAPFWLEKGPVPFTIRVANTSKHFINPKGQVLIKNMFGMTIGRVDLLPVNILSGTTRIIPGTSGSKQVVVNNSALWPEKFLLGPYTATLTISLSEQGPILKKTVHFIG
ncbi:hypothetical protein M1349_04075, partial [Patescibacteria group bacterium]|nr:hypothetical protein [Patescibacteria group bacterium]